MSAGGRTLDEVLAFLTDVVCRNSEVPRHVLRTDVCLERYGIDSLQWANIAYELSLWLGRHISPDDVAGHETIHGMAQALVQE